MSACGRGNCTGRMRRMWRQRGPLDATPFRCSNCGRETHASICVDREEGTIECVCGLAEIVERRTKASAP